MSPLNITQPLGIWSIVATFSGDVQYSQNGTVTNPCPWLTLEMRFMMRSWSIYWQTTLIWCRALDTWFGIYNIYICILSVPSYLGWWWWWWWWWYFGTHHHIYICIHSTSLICHLRLLNFFKGEDRKVGNAQWIGGGMWLCQCVFRSGECRGISFILSSWNRWLTYPQVKCINHL